MPIASRLTAKQARFVAEYLVDGNGAGAAVRAGYGAGGAKVAASRLLTKDNVQAALRTRQAADATRLGIARDDVLQGLLMAVQKARELEDPMGMITGLREIARLMGYIAPSRVKVDVAVGANAQHDLQAQMKVMSDQQLAAIVVASYAPA
jgi:hypothetical protein